MPPRFFFVGVLIFFASGCSEGTKANPLPRAGATAPHPAVKTLYERLGREAGLTQVVNQLITNLDAAPRTTALAGRIKKRVLIDFTVRNLSARTDSISKMVNREMKRCEPRANHSR